MIKAGFTHSSDLERQMWEQHPVSDGDDRFNEGFHFSSRFGFFFFFVEYPSMHDVKKALNQPALLNSTKKIVK